MLGSDAMRQAVQAFSGGRLVLVLGLGVGHRAVNKSIGIEMGDTFADFRSLVGFLREAWVKGPHQPRPATPPALYAAAVASNMIELVGEVCDGAIFNLFPLSRYPKALGWLRRGAARAGPVVITRNGRAVAILLAPIDDDDLERLLLARSPRFQSLLAKSRASIRKGKGLTHAVFWRAASTQPARVLPTVDIKPRRLRSARPRVP